MPEWEWSYQKNWTLEDIMRYVEGDMSADEIQQIESDLEKDPFLRDAVDGYSGHARIYTDHHLNQLQSRFHTHPVTRSGSRMMSIAAVILLLIAGGWYVFSIRGDSETLTSDRQEDINRQEVQVTDEFNERQPNDTSFDMSARDEMASNERRSVFDQRTPIGTPQSATSKRSGVKQRKKVGNGLVTGRVIDADGQPLIGATIRFPNNDAEITTDFDGKFAVDLNANDSTAIVDFAGFKTSIFPLVRNGKQTFQLIEGIAIEESMVSTPEVSLLSSDKKVSIPQVPVLALDTTAAENSSNPIALTSEATPERGLRKFDKYIKRNLKYPAAAETAQIEGDVIVQFKVLPGGELFDIRIIQSLGYGCDEEAIRLIKEGPAWETLDPELIGQATYTITFKL